MGYQRTGIVAAVAVMVWGIYEMHTSVAAISAADVHAITAELRTQARLNRNTYNWLSDKSADRMESVRGLSPDERSSLSIAAADLNGVPGRAFAITVSGVSQDTCEDVVKIDPGDADSLVVNGEAFGRGYSKSAAEAKCHPVFWLWPKRNTVVISGS